MDHDFDPLDLDYLADPQRLPDLRLSPSDQRFEFDPNLPFRGPKEPWTEWTPD
ncbi:MAG: hypothetical protein M3N00_09330 [Actinomycetota bacterium]|nr:hypothetical protein [Actinomycetota bacterium]